MTLAAAIGACFINFTFSNNYNFSIQIILSHQFFCVFVYLKAKFVLLSSQRPQGHFYLTN